MFYSETTCCPICGKKTVDEYCPDCIQKVSDVAEWLGKELNTDWEKVLDLMGYYYERSY